MFKTVLTALLAFFAAAAFAAVDVNKADAAALDTVKGIGPGIAGKILDERKNGAFKNWDDLVGRVKGIGEVNAAKLSEGGLTVNGSGFKGMTAAPAAAAQGKVDAKPMAAAPAAAPMEAQKFGSAKAEAKAEMKKDDKIATKPKKAKKAKSNKPVKAG